MCDRTRPTQQVGQMIPCYIYDMGGGLKLTDDREEGEGLGLFLFLLF